MKYLKVFTDFAKSIEILSDAEKGRLFNAMLTYAETGEEPNLNGNERFVWPTAKMNIDRQEQSYKNKANAAAIARQNNPKNCSESKQTDNSSKQNCSELISVQDNDNEKDNDKKINKKNNSSQGKFVPPTLEEVEAYCKERNNNVDPKYFYDYFTTGHWKDSKGNPVRNWKQKIITWEKGGYGSAGTGNKPGTQGNSGKVQSKYAGVNFYDNV